MEVLICLKKIIPFILFLFLVVDGCNEAIAPDLNNKNDPNAVSFQGELPSDLKLTILSDNAIKLEWKDNSDYEAGYTIERSINNENNFVEIGKVGPNVTSFIDSNAIVYDSYTYRVRISNVKTNITAAISSKPYTEKINLADKVGDFCLSPNGKYIAIAKYQMVTVLNASDGRELLNYPAESVVRYAISNDYIAVASTYTAIDDKRVINIWKIIDGSLLTSFKTTGEVDAMAFNHSGNILAIGDFITLSIWNIKAVPSPTVEKHQDMAGFSYLEFTEDDKYLMQIQNSTSPSFTIYNTNTWQAVYSKEIPNKTFPHFINDDVVFYLDNSFIFYDLKQENNISTIEDTLNYGKALYREFKVNINKSGSILSAYKSNNKLSGGLIVKTDLWLLNEHNLLKKIKTIDLGNELPTKNAFSSRNDFIVLTASKNLYLWKYY
jgi:hypothetical protein